MRWEAATAFRGRRPHAAACDSFCSSRSTRVDGRKCCDLLWPAIRGRSGGWNKGFDTGPFRYVFCSGPRAHDRKSSGRQLLLQCENRSTGSEEVGHLKANGCVWLVSTAGAKSDKVPDGRVGHWRPTGIILVGGMVQCCSFTWETSNNRRGSELGSIGRLSHVKAGLRLRCLYAWCGNQVPVQSTCVPVRSSDAAAGGL